MSEEEFLRQQYEEQGGSESPDYPSEGEGGCGRYLYVILGIAAVFILANVWRYYGLMGTFTGTLGQLTIYNEANVELDTAAIETAAQPLRQNFGIDIKIIIVQSTATIEPFSNLASHNYQRDTDNLPPNSLVIVIGIDEQYSEISWGANLNRLDGDRLRGSVLNPRLNERDYTGALVNTFTQSLPRLQDGDLAFQELLSGYGEYIDEGIIIAALLGFLALAFYFRGEGNFEGGTSNSYRPWRSSSSSSTSRSSGGSSSSGRRSGGSSRGSWKN